MWTSPNIETHYHLARGLPPTIFTVTRVEGGSSVQVSETEDNEEPVLDIYLSSEQKKRDCALVADFPKQLLEALKIQHFDAAKELHQYLEVPLEALNTLLVKNGVIGETRSSSASLDTFESDETSDNEDQQQLGGIVAPLATPEQRSSVTPFSTPLTELSRPSAVVVGPPVPSTQSPRNPESISSILAVETSIRNTFSQSGFSIPPERPEEAPPTEPVTSAGIYSTSNRSRNIDRLRQFAQHSRTNLNASRSGTSNAANNPIAAAFDMTQLGLALEDSQASVDPAALVSPWGARRPQARLIPDRNEEDRDRNPEIGFLGEHYVGDPVTCPIGRGGLADLASRCSQFYVTSSDCPISAARSIGPAHCGLVPDSAPAARAPPTLPTQTRRELLHVISNKCSFHIRNRFGSTQSSAMETSQRIASK